MTKEMEAKILYQNLDRLLVGSATYIFDNHHKILFIYVNGILYMPSDKVAKIDSSARTTWYAYACYPWKA